MNSNESETYVLVMSKLSVQATKPTNAHKYANL